MLLLQIMHMVWGNQRMPADRHQQPWKPKFLSLKAADIYLFDQPPVSSYSHAYGHTFIHSMTLSVCLTFSLSRSVFLCLFSLFLSVCLSACLCLCISLSVCLSPSLPPAVADSEILLLVMLCVPDAFWGLVSL